MRYGASHKARSKSSILKAAAMQIRARGPHKVAVSEVMSAAGLTHGAFYAHFGSKDGLVAEAVFEMFADAAERSGLKDLLSLENDQELRGELRVYLEGYLSPSHRDKPERGCPLPILAADIARSDRPTRQNFVSGMVGMTGRIDQVLARIGHPKPQAAASATVAQMVGAVGLARAMGPGAESDAMLRDCLLDILERLGL
jgi:TetR/AcrR family transcriptional repressor of nem operon